MSAQKNQKQMHVCDLFIFSEYKLFLIVDAKLHYSDILLI